MNPVLVEVYRGQTVESAHRGSVAVVDADGGCVLALGDVQRPVFPRSAVKLLQALPLVASGAAERFGLGDEELALACASHNGEPAHVATAAGMLAKAGVDAQALECGAHWPYREALQREMAARGETPGALHNNCSGKHAGFICLGCAIAGDRPLFGWDLSNAPQGIDGCSIPTFGIPLRHLALAFARAGSGVGLDAAHARAARRLRQAVARAPFMVGGTDRFDTRVMQRLGERVCCKVGAEGVYCAAFPDRGLGVALKIDDGNNARAAEVAMAALIEAFVTLDEDEARLLRSLSHVRLKNWNGIVVGSLRASPCLRSVCTRFSV